MAEASTKQTAQVQMSFPDDAGHKLASCEAVPIVNEDEFQPKEHLDLVRNDQSHPNE